MRALKVVVALVAVLVLAACPDEDAQVLPEVITRTPSDLPSSVPTSPLPTVTAASPSPTATTATPTEATTSPSEVEPTPTATSEEPTPTPTPTSTPAYALPEGPGWSYVTWTPAQTSDGRPTWDETSAAPPVTPDDPGGARAEPLRVGLRDAREPDPDGTPFRYRYGYCAAWLQAPADQPLSATGTVTVRVRSGDRVLFEVAHAVDTVVAAGQRADLPFTDSREVDAAAGEAVTCDVVYTAG